VIQCDINTESVTFKPLTAVAEDRLCGLVARVPGYRSRDPGSIPSATRFSEKHWAWNGALWVQLKSCLAEIVAAPFQKIEITAVRDPPRWLRDNHYPQKLTLASLASRGLSVGIVRSRTKAAKLLLLFRRWLKTEVTYNLRPFNSADMFWSDWAIIIYDSLNLLPFIVVLHCAWDVVVHTHYPTEYVELRKLKLSP
jgi:hypothetical protein